ncbi:MAG: lysine--tRNA ligase [Candidatus Sungbacteria bacterium RIFCSPLOWO2_01_FULL_59_16]|uniref:Lysine--tRNA ligase n=1 Tax=Candidatus Sungbacteria bacterium RIFCSPLOWO2_01_FULL_59_16 TaxID=1802280 RepID=A0A1G2LAT0_9BACT|nr:MAG: lysine--tRNA ligase [Candidatus Sungbacteria bacterium RIFCSPLOWO2_01_FULL_59_16]
MALDDIRRDRLAKLERYEAAGLDPYPASARRNFLIREVLQRFAPLARSKRRIIVAGRLRALREHGGMAFGDLEDGSGTMQLSFARDFLGDGYSFFRETADIGDILEAVGSAFKTKRGEPTLRISSWRIIAKSLRPLPEKWHGLKDVEERFRKRYLDLVMNEKVRDRFRRRAEIVKALREFFEREGFMEVETPILQHLAGGALARPFKTHHNALAIDLHLRIAPELYLKELLVGGMEKIYELGKSFRNEGVDATHNPEFTTVEWYAAYWDEEAMMGCMERFFAFLLKRLKLRSTLMFGEKTVTVPKRFLRIEFSEVLKRYALIIDYDRETRDSLASRAQRFGIDAGPGDSKGKIADEIYKKICRPHLVNPTFVIHHPIDISPLAKRTAPDATTVRRFQLIVGGLEIVNAFAELNDPREQRARFEEQKKLRSGGEEEAHPFDEEFVEALEYGMPPAAGAGLGVDRLVMLLTDAANVREAVLFPTLRPKA